MPTRPWTSRCSSISRRETGKPFPEASGGRRASHEVRRYLNLLSQSGTQTYSVELWSADVAGTNVSALLTAIGSGTISSNDKTAVTSFTSPYSLTAATDYFIKVVASSGSFAIALGPNSSATLNSIVRYGVGNLNNNTTGVALGMDVDVATVPEPAAATLFGIVAGAAGLVALRRRPARLAGPEPGRSR